MVVLYPFEIGRVANQADGAALIRYGDIVMLVTVVAANEFKADMDFFPLNY
jgi:polyribonucleotide nucleotidyltransferase